MKKLCFIGTGYVGLVGAAIFSDWGNQVVGVDLDEKKIKRIEAGEMPIYEPGLAEIVLRNINSKNLSFTTSLKEGISDAEIVFICVGTPQGDDGRADLKYVWQVAEDIGKNLSGGYKVIVTKSTVPVGTNERVKEIISEHAPKSAKFDVASNPEFLAEGTAVRDMYNTDRTVIGSDSEQALKVLREFYSHLNSPIVESDLRTAEMIKYASNAILATKISFINEIGQLCERAGANVDLVARGMGLDRRIGSKMLNVSIGFGGSCFPKDVSALYRTSTDQAYDFKLLRGVIEVNNIQRLNFLAKIKKYMGTDLSDKTIGVLGLAFKANTDDIRESAPVRLVQDLRGLGANLQVFDPQAMDNTKREIGTKNIVFSKDAYSALEGCDALCVLTEWDEFRELDFTKVKGLMKHPVIFDGRNHLNQESIEKSGFIYFAIGKITNGLSHIKGDDIKASYSSALLRRNGK